MGYSWVNKIFSITKHFCGPANSAACETSRWVIRMKYIASFLLLLILAGTAHSNEQPNIVVSVEHSTAGFVVLLDGKKESNILLALSERNHPDKPSKLAFLFVDPKTTIHEMSNMLGIMSKAGFIKPRIFVVSEDKTVMSELTTGCSMLYSSDASKFVLAHGGYGCTQ